MKRAVQVDLTEDVKGQRETNKCNLLIIRIGSSANGMTIKLATTKYKLFNFIDHIQEGL